MRFDTERRDAVRWLQLTRRVFVHVALRWAWFKVYAVHVESWDCDFWVYYTPVGSLAVRRCGLSGSAS